MRQATTAAKLFDQIVAETPPELKKQLDMSFAIADKLDAALKERGLTQKEFAHMIGHTQAEVSRWLSGTHNFTLATLAKISVALGVNLFTV
ncbi:MAG: helix-turn-helix transcriptional regulator [Muribaculaceae bacterium]|nr:helix-turn-helix transcriptional regulator [Muribaculaceae bacterium]